MAVRVYRAPQGPSPTRAYAAQHNITHVARATKQRVSSRAFAAADDVFEEPSADRDVADRKAKKETRAGRRELEAARRQQREMREESDDETY